MDFLLCSKNCFRLLSGRNVGPFSLGAVLPTLALFAPCAGGPCAEARERFLQKLRDRESPVGDPTPPQFVIPFKLPYFPQLSRLGLKRRMIKLIEELRRATDEDFLQGAKIVVANTVRKNVFLESYRLNFLLNETLQDVDRMVAGVEGSVCDKVSTETTESNRDWRHKDKNKQ